MSLDDEARPLALAHVRVRGIATLYAKKEYGWKHVDTQIIGQLKDESFHLRVKGTDLDGNQEGDAVELKVSESGTVTPL